MKESSKSYLKRFLRTGACGLGWLSTIIGFLLGVHALDVIPEGASEFMPFALTSAATLIGGIHLLSIWWQKPLAEWRKLSEEERAVRNLKRYAKQRNQNIAVGSFLLIFMVSVSMWILWREYELNSIINPDQIRTMASFEDPKYELPILFSRFYDIAALRAKLKVYECYFGLFTGLAIFMLINEFAGFTRNKHKLTLTMWERIKQLEGEVKALKAHIQSDAPQIG